jgi:uncharacterized protein YkwD
MRTVALLTFASGCLLAAVLAVPAAAAAAGNAAHVDDRERAMIRGINARRADHGLSPVRVSKRLTRAADYHSWEMLDANYFAHTSRDGGPFDERVRRFARHRALGETLAMLRGGCGAGSAGRIVQMWMDSPPHRAILLSSKYRRIGLARRTGKLDGERACVVTADFGSRK